MQIVPNDQPSLQRPQLPDPKNIPLDDDTQWERLRQLLIRQSGLDCQYYKINYLKRRVAVRMRATGSRTYAEYNRVLNRDAAEYERLLDRLTINVSHFFRDRGAFAALDKKVIRELSGKENFRVWSAGCANGEEPYSIAMLLADQLGSSAAFHVLATDIDLACLKRARLGIYPGKALEEVPSRVRERWFGRRVQKDGWEVKPSIRGRVSFERRDLTGDLPRGPFDLILCRNVMIYFNRQLQEHLVKEFYGRLQPAGFLMLGKTEILLSECRQLFQTVDLSERIYQCQTGV